MEKTDLIKALKLTDKRIDRAIEGMTTDPQQEEYYLAEYDGGWGYLDCLFSIRKGIKNLIKEVD